MKIGRLVIVKQTGIDKDMLIYETYSHCLFPELERILFSFRHMASQRRVTRNF